MGRNTKDHPSNATVTQQKIVTLRREYVARMILEGLTVRETAIALTKLPEPIKSPKTQDGVWDVHTIQRDIDALRRQWRENALADITEYKARQIAEIEHAKRIAWANVDLTAIVRLLRLEAEVTGTLVMAGDKGPNWKELARSLGLDPELLWQFVEQSIKNGAPIPGMAGARIVDGTRIIDAPKNGNGSHA